MHSAISAGNYPSEIWPRIIKYIKTDNFPGWHGLTNTAPRSIKSPYFLLIDIHNFSKLCQECARKDRKRKTKTEMRNLAKFLRAFFWDMSEHVHRNGGMNVKFIGDAILANHQRKGPLIKMGKNLLKLYQSNFQKTHPITNVVVLITHPQECLKGFVGSSDYIDYSFWAPGLNYLFSQTKNKKVLEGHVYYVERNGAVNKCW